MHFVSLRLHNIWVGFTYTTAVPLIRRLNNPLRRLAVAGRVAVGVCSTADRIYRIPLAFIPVFKDVCMCVCV